MDRTWNILLVDDDPDFLMAAQRVLRRSTHMRANVMTAQQASEALRIVEERLFDVIVADYRMEPKDGAEFLREVHETNPDARRVLLTGFNERYIRSDKPGVDADLVLDKNDPLGQLDRKLTDFLEHNPPGTPADRDPRRRA